MPKIERLKKQEAVEYCKMLGIETKGKTKNELISSVNKFLRAEIRDSIKKGTDLELLTSQIETLANDYSINLKGKIDARKEEMKSDDNSHYLIYRVLGIATEEGRLIDEYQNTGRFLYKFAGSFLEEAASICLQFKNPEGGKTYVDNNQGRKPKKFEK